MPSRPPPFTQPYFHVCADIKFELKKKDDEFVKTLKRQAEDVDTLLQYMSHQFVEVQAAYKEELDEIEAAFLQVCGGVRGLDAFLDDAQAEARWYPGGV